MKKNIKFWLFISLCIIHYSAIAGNDTIIVAITKFDTRGYDTSWLKACTPKIRFVNLYSMPLQVAIMKLKECDALLVTGGEDVNPALYNKENELGICGEPDKRRDTLEISSIKLAMQLRIPILGICRGEQILNVANGGSLITDIPHCVGISVLHNTIKNKTANHIITVEKTSRLYTILKQESGIVNSFHHQSIDITATNFREVARTNDGVIEAIEINDTSSFALGIQWHPEQMSKNSSFSKNIAEAFIENSRRYHAAFRK